MMPTASAASTSSSTTMLGRTVSSSSRVLAAPSMARASGVRGSIASAHGAASPSSSLLCRCDAQSRAQFPCRTPKRAIGHSATSPLLRSSFAPLLRRPFPPLPRRPLLRPPSAISSPPSDSSTDGGGDGEENKNSIVLFSASDWRYRLWFCFCSCLFFFFFFFFSFLPQKRQAAAAAPKNRDDDDENDFDDDGNNGHLLRPFPRRGQLRPLPDLLPRRRLRRPLGPPRRRPGGRRLGRGLGRAAPRAVAAEARRAREAAPRPRRLCPARVRHAPRPPLGHHRAQHGPGRARGARRGLRLLLRRAGVGLRRRGARGGRQGLPAVARRRAAVPHVAVVGPVDAVVGGVR